jgi:hypothetical protein
MKRATITIGGDLEKAIESYAALREYLARRGAVAPANPLRITAAKKGSGKADISQDHDRYFAADA